MKGAAEGKFLENEVSAKLNKFVLFLHSHRNKVAILRYPLFLNNQKNALYMRAPLCGQAVALSPKRTIHGTFSLKARAIQLHGSDIQIEGLHVAFNLLPHSRMERNCCRMDGVAFCTYECESAKATLCSNSEQHVHSRALRKMHQYTPSPGVGIKAREREREICLSKCITPILESFATRYDLKLLLGR